MSEQDDSRRRFLDELKSYESQKENGQAQDASIHALQAIEAIHEITGDRDPDKAADAVYELMDAFITKDQAGELYQELSDASGIDPEQ